GERRRARHHPARPGPLDPPGRHRQRAPHGRGVGVGGIWAAAFLMRRLRAERGVLVLLVLLVAATSLIVAAAPRLYNSVADAGLRSILAETSVPRRNIALTRDVPATPEDLTPEALRQQGADLTNQFDPAIQSVIESREVMVASPRFRVEPGPKFRTFVTLRSQSGVDDAIDLVAGRWPA